MSNRKKKLSKKVYLMVTEDSSPVPTPYIPGKNDTVIGGSTVVVISTPTPSASPVATATATTPGKVGPIRKPRR